MTDKELRALLDLMVCSDPWPDEAGEGNQDVVVGLLARESRSRGFADEIEAYHELSPQDLR